MVELPPPPAGANEAQYWKTLAHEKAEELEAMQNDFLDFQETSQMTEEEVTHSTDRHRTCSDRLSGSTGRVPTQTTRAGCSDLPHRAPF